MKPTVRREQRAFALTQLSHHSTLEEFRILFLGNGTTLRVYSGLQQYNQDSLP